MSGEGPESIPTSADPRSKRPTKKRALSPLSAQAKEVDALFARPVEHGPIRVPETANKKQRALPPPPEIVANVQGSSAGAGSGEFHVYKASRRREYERLRRMDEEVAREKADEEFERKRQENLRRDDEKTRKNREKREKAKMRKAVKGGRDSDNDKRENGENSAAVPSKVRKPKLAPRKKTVDEETIEDREEPISDLPDKASGEMKGIVIEEDRERHDFY